MIAIGYYWFVGQIGRLIYNHEGIFKDRGVKHVCILLMGVFIFCGNSKWLGCSGSIWNDLPLLILQYSMIIIIEVNFGIIKNIQSQQHLDNVVEGKDSQIRNLIEEVFSGQEIKDWFFHQSLHGAVNSDGYFILLSDKWSETLGWTKKEMTEKQFIEFVHPEDRDEKIRV